MVAPRFHTRFPANNPLACLHMSGSAAAGVFNLFNRGGVAQDGCSRRAVIAVIFSQLGPDREFPPCWHGESGLIFRRKPPLSAVCA